MNEEEVRTLSQSTFLGDGVYLHVNEAHVTLLTSDGESITNRVHLDPHVFDNFMHELGRLGHKLDYPA